MTRRQYAGGAAATTITTPIASSGGGTVTITTTTGWPDGAVGKFHVVIDPGNSSEEKILCDLRSGTTLSFASGGRGADGTVSTSHSAGAQIWLCYTALDADEANAHINATTASHSAAQITFAPVGSIAATTVQAAIAELDTGGDARLDVLETSTTAIQANNWVTQARMADASVGTAELIDGNVTAAKIASPDVLSLTRAASVIITSPTIYTVVWDTEVSDPSGFITTPSDTITVPSGLGGLYAITFVSICASTPTHTPHIIVNDGALKWFTAGSMFNNRMCHSVVIRLAPTNTVQCAASLATGSANFTFAVTLHRLTP